MKNLITMCFLACTIPLFAQKKPFEINGEINNAEAKIIYLYYQSKKEADSTIVVNHKFRFHGETQDIEFIALKIGDMRYPTVLEPGKLNIFFANENINEVRVSGQQPAIDFKSCLLVLNPFFDQIKLIRNKHQEAAGRRDTVAMIALGKENDKIYADRIAAVKQWTANHLNSMISPYIIQTELKSLPFVELEKQYSKLNITVKKSKGGEDLATFMNSKKMLRLGQVAPAFHQKTNTGYSFSLENVKGNYILLDFWASWCVPCRQENPALIALYHDFKKRNFKIVSISLDEYKNSWLKAIKDDQLIGYQLSDLKGWKNEVAVLYGIGSLPTTFLLDPELKIIAINPDIKLLNKMLEPLLK